MNVEIELTEPVSLTFSLKYLVNFCKAAGLSKSVKLCLSNEVPLLVEYGLAGSSYLRFYLAPKVCPIKCDLYYLYTDTLSRSVTRNRRFNNGMGINDGMRVSSIFECGAKVDFMDMESPVLRMGENRKSSSQYYVFRA